MQPNSTFLTRLGGLGLAGVLRAGLCSLDCKIAYYDITADPARPEFEGPCIFAFWHEYLAFPVSLWGNCNITMLVSHHRDAQWLVEASGYLGYEIVRGSTNRGGTEAIRQLRQVCSHSSLAVTPDGPRGPRREMALGPVYLASRLGIPLVPVGFAYDRPWRLSSWDNFAVPRPFSRGRAVWGPKMHIPRKLKRDGLEAYRVRTGKIITRLTSEAEQWAASGARRAGERPFYSKWNNKQIETVLPSRPQLAIDTCREKEAA